jgi:hypothetical protein
LGRLGGQYQIWKIIGGSDKSSEDLTMKVKKLEKVKPTGWIWAG